MGEPAPTRDHTERAIRALGGPIVLEGPTVTVSSVPARRVHGHRARRPVVGGLPRRRGRDHGIGAHDRRGRASTRAGSTSWTCSRGWGFGPSAVSSERSSASRWGTLWVAPCEGLRPIRVERRRAPAGDRRGPDPGGARRNSRVATRWFLGAGELRVKESDRLAAISKGIRDLGGHAGDEGDDLVVAGGGLDGGRVGPAGTTGSRWRSPWRALASSRTGRGRGRRGCRGVASQGSLRTLRAPRRLDRGHVVRSAIPRIVAIDGAAGSGKSTLAGASPRRLDAAVHQHRL